MLKTFPFQSYHSYLFQQHELQAHCQIVLWKVLSNSNVVEKLPQFKDHKYVVEDGVVFPVYTTEPTSVDGLPELQPYKADGCKKSRGYCCLVQTSCPILLYMYLYAEMCACLYGYVTTLNLCRKIRLSF
mmetsp:Transcript_33320/g.43961  ORF Transcript_33320/g.43961 Transcript_33320/m.43961 type:complete len:129 (+) Transcript_33320:813-1199(+)